MAEPTPRERERTKLIRMRELERYVSKGLDGEIQCLIVEFHNDDQNRFTAKVFEAPKKGRR